MHNVNTAGLRKRGILSPPICAGLLVVLLPWLGGAAAAENYAPASFGDGEKSLGQLIEFPELRGDANATISCITLVTRKGKLKDHGCYLRNPGDETFVAAVQKVAKKARLQPAMLDGRAVEVVFQYRVNFISKGEEQSLDFVANPGYPENVEAYGQRHIAAQRAFDKEKWKAACPKHAKFVVLAKVNVDFDGSAGAANLSHVDGINITEKCENALVESLLASRFVPAMVDGEAVPSTYLEPFGN